MSRCRSVPVETVPRKAVLLNGDITAFPAVVMTSKIRYKYDNFLNIYHVWFFFFKPHVKVKMFISSTMGSHRRETVMSTN